MAIACWYSEIADAKSREPKTEDTPAAPQVTPVTPYVLRLKEALRESEGDIKILKREEQRLRDGIAAYQARVENVPRREQEYRELSRDFTDRARTVRDELEDRSTGRITEVADRVHDRRREGVSNHLP